METRRYESKARAQLHQGDGFPVSKEALSMYAIPGFALPTEKDIKRYTDTKRKLRALLSALITQGLQHEDRYVRQEAASMIFQAPERDQQRLREYYNSKEDITLKQFFEKTLLYEKTSDRFFRAPFSKTGSRITLLDSVPGQRENTLKRKVLIRHIPFTAYHAWSRAFEAHAFWREKGFDYVPVEPILRVYVDSKKVIEVASLQEFSVQMLQHGKRIRLVFMIISILR